MFRYFTVMKIVIFEDENYINFFPLTIIRPIYELKIGFHPVFKHICDFFSSEAILYTRDYLCNIVKLRNKSFKVNFIDDHDVLLINGRLIPKNDVLNFIKSLSVEKDSFIISDLSGGIVAAKLKYYLLEHVISNSINGIINSNILRGLHGKCDFIQLNEHVLLENIWDLITLNEDFLKADFKSSGLIGELDDKTVVYGSKSNIYVGANSKIEGYVNIDVRGGPVYIGSGVKIFGPCRIEGPAYIGDETIILAGARIRAGSNIGNTCRVGGEVEASILHGYVNMYHPSFIGHSYVGEWVNLGAFTVTSDLKNTYGNIRVKIGNNIVDTGLNKLGSFIGDHVKTSINCGIFAGKRIGVFSHLIGYVYEDVPSFTIYAKTLINKSYELKLESALETMRRVYSRRGKTLSNEEVELVKYLFKASEDERIEAGVLKGELIL